MVMCVFTLMLVVLLLGPRLLTRTVGEMARDAGLVFRKALGVPSRAPSLHMLCISRT